jgi:membrane protein
MPDQNPPSRDPARRGWLKIAGRTLRESTTDRVSLAAAGCAFYATLALFPAISMLISIYGLMFDPTSVEPQLQALAQVLPPPAFTLIEERIHELTHQPKANLSLTLLIGVTLTFWSSASGAKSVLSAVNVAYDVTAQRPFLRFQAIGLAMTLVSVLCAVLAIAVLVALPVALAFLGLSSLDAALIQRVGLLMLVAFFAIAIALLYRFGPARVPPPNQHIGPGAVLATLLWLFASEVLSWYIRSIGNYGATYGSLGAVVGVMLWFYVSAYAVLLGAELNARLEEE